MGFLEFDKCCFCIDLRTGCLIIGYFNLVVEIIFILMSIMGLAAFGVVTVAGKDDPDMQTIGTVMMAMIVIMLIFLILFLVFTIVLLVGLHKYKRGHVKAYIVYTSIFVVLSIIMFFAGFAGTISAGKIVQDLLSIVISVYFLLVIRSYYLKMDDPANKPAIYNTA